MHHQIHTNSIRIKETFAIKNLLKKSNLFLRRSGQQAPVVRIGCLM